MEETRRVTEAERERERDPNTERIQRKTRKWNEM